MGVCEILGKINVFRLRFSDKLCISYNLIVLTKLSLFRTTSSMNLVQDVFFENYATFLLTLSGTLVNTGAINKASKNFWFVDKI